MSVTKIRDGTLVLFPDTPDELSCDPSSREPVALPAYKLAELVERSQEPTDEPQVPLSQVMPYLVRQARQLVPAGANQPTRDDLEQAITAQLLQGANLNRKRTWEHIVTRAQRIAMMRKTSQSKRQAAQRTRRQAATDEQRRIEERKQLYRDWGMQVPSTARVRATLDQPFIPSKHALERKRRREATPQE